MHGDSVKVPPRYRPLLRRLQRGTWPKDELLWLLAHDRLDAGHRGWRGPAAAGGGEKQGEAAAVRAACHRRIDRCVGSGSP